MTEETKGRKANDDVAEQQTALLTAQLVNCEIRRPHASAAIDAPMPPEEQIITEIRAFYLEVPGQFDEANSVFKLDLPREKRIRFLSGPDKQMLIVREIDTEDLSFTWSNHSIRVSVHATGRIDIPKDTMSVKAKPLEVTAIYDRTNTSLPLTHGVGAAVKSHLEKSRLVAYDVFTRVLAEPPESA